MVVDTLLDFAGFDYRRPSTGSSSWNQPYPAPGRTSAWRRNFPCGEATYRLDRPIGGTVHHLSLKARLDHPVTLQAAVTCPGLTELGPWQSNPDSPPPDFDPRTGRLVWSIGLPAEEEIVWSWTWG